MLRISCFAAVALIAATTHAQSEVVYLRNGGEVRGSLIESSPQSGVVLRMPDNTIRTIPAAAIGYVGMQGTGGLRISTPEPARVTLDRQEVGRTPLELHNIPLGAHRLRVAFDGGGSSDYQVVIQPGQIASVSPPLPALRLLGVHRQGVHFALGGGPQAGSSPNDEPLLAVGAQAGINVGISPAVDFRLLGLLSLGSEVDRGEFFYEFGVSAAFRFNLSSVYSMELGGRIGLMPVERWAWTSSYDDDYERTATPVFGVQASLLSLRLGPDRGYELTLWHALQAGVDTDPSFRTGISFTRIWP